VAVRSIHDLFSLRMEKYVYWKLLSGFFSRFHLIYVVINVFEDIDPASSEFIKKKSFPFGGKNFF
jgi:hypothetical protein